MSFAERLKGAELKDLGGSMTEFCYSFLYHFVLGGCTAALLTQRTGCVLCWRNVELNDFILEISHNLVNKQPSLRANYSKTKNFPRVFFKGP